MLQQRRMILIACTLSTLVGLSNGSHAAFANNDGNPRAASTSAPVPSSDPAVVYLMSEYGVTEEEAQRRLAVQHIAAEVDERLREASSSTYAGMWIDQLRGGRLVLSSTDPLGIDSGSLGELDLAEVVVRHVRYSLDDLAELHRRLEQELGDAGFVAGVDVRANTLQVQEWDPRRFATQTAEIRRAYPEAIVVVGRRHYSRDACNVEYCDPPLRGGTRIVPSGSVSGCTGGFNVRSRSDGAAYLLTAGHCLYGKQGSTWTTRFTDGSIHDVGPTHNYVYPGADYGIIRLTNSSGWNPGPYIRISANVFGNPPATDFYTIYGSSGSVVGGTVCRQGHKSGSTCGTITYLGHQANYAEGRVYNLAVVRPQTCSQGGDSGGPWFASGRAMGVHSGGSTDPNTPCESYYQGVTAALDGMNVNLMLG